MPRAAWGQWASPELKLKLPGAWRSRLHLVTDGHGLILGATLTADQTHEATQLCQVMHAVRRPRRIGWPRKLAGDKGYSYDTLRAFLAGCCVEPVIPRRSDQPRPRGERFDKRTYRKRCRVGQAVGWVKECRRLGARHEKLELNFLAFVHLGIMLRYLRVLDPSGRT